MKELLTRIKRGAANLIFFLVYHARVLKILLAGIRRMSGQHPALILMYHRFSEGKNDNLLDHLHVREFEKQLDYLTKNYRIVSLDQLIAVKKRGGRLEKPLAVLTMDDGYLNNYQVAFPVLNKFKAPAIIYLTAGFVGTRNGLWLDDIEAALTHTREHTFSMPELFGGTCFSISKRDEKRHLLHQIYLNMLTMAPDRKADFIEIIFNRLQVDYSDKGKKRHMMNWEEVREMHRDGVLFGAHTMTHPTLSRLPEKDAEEEIIASKREIERQMGKAVVHFAIPNGRDEDFTPQLREFCSRAGFETIMTTNYGAVRLSDDFLSLKRLPTSGPMHVFAGKLAKEELKQALRFFRAGK